jgi:hypothetical protein|tara:strand:+ start:798 stop:1127 length:330 start_codon:yes stop_codon:yes gene_type:complete
MKKLIAKYDLIDCKDDYDCDVHWENFKDDLDYYFNKYLGCKVIVKGKNMTWRNLSGLKNFNLDNVMDIFEKVIPQTSQLDFYLYQTGKNNFKATVGHHDGAEQYYYKVK